MVLEDALGDRAFQPQRAADGKDTLAHRQRIRAADGDKLEFRRVLVLDLEQREIGEFVHGDNPHLFVGLALQLPVPLMINLDGDLRFTFDDMEVGDQKTVAVDEESRAQGAGGAHLHHGLAELVDEVADVSFGPGPVAQLIQSRAGIRGRTGFEGRGRSGGRRSGLATGGLRERGRHGFAQGNPGDRGAGMTSTV